MSTRVVRLTDLVGRTVRDVDGRAIGKIEELTAEIELHAEGNDYVVTGIALGRYGPLDMIASGDFVPSLVQRWRRLTGYRRYEVPWNWLDLSDPALPRLVRRA
ncbi:MAG: hypothetical protein JWL95_3059 [Gemmatimonadetes bacterium]|nr:hypothetical protein [Gemmatimonadota bacterium]